MINWERLNIVIDGPKQGPYEITYNTILNEDGVIKTTARTIKVRDFRLEEEGIIQ